MKAMRIHEYDNDLKEPMHLDEVDPPRPGPGQLLVKAGAIGVNPIEISYRKGIPSYASRITLPFVLGVEAAGTVEETGEGAEGFASGDRVFGYNMLGGVYAEYVLLGAATAAHLPESFTFAQGAALPVAFYTAWNALVIQSHAGAGETVLIQGGAGGVGIATIQLARAMGCRVIATVSSEEKAEFCRSFGADETINYREADFAERCKALTGGRGVDLIIELAACDNFDKDLDAIRQDGTIVFVGMGTGKGPNATFRVPGVMGNNAIVTGVSARTLGPKLPEVIRRMAPLWEEKNLRVPIHQEWPLAEAGAAHEVLMSGKFLGKLVLIP